MTKEMVKTQNSMVTIEQAFALTGKKALDFFSDAEKVRPLIDQVKQQALSLVPNVKTDAGRKAIGSNALSVSQSRKAITDAIDQSVASLVAKVDAAKTVKKEVELELNAVRLEVLKPRQEWQAEKDRIEAERVAAIQLKIDGIRNLGSYDQTESTESIGNKIDALENIDVSDFFQEFTAEAAKAIQEATAQLNYRIVEIIEDKKKAEQAALLEQAHRASKIQERLSNLMQIPLSMIGKSAHEINGKITSLSRFEITDAEFDPRTDEAKASLEQVVIHLTVMKQQAEMMEKMASAAAEKPEQAESFKTIEAEAAPQVETGVKPGVYIVRAEWSGYSRGYSVYEVAADNEQDALDSYSEGDRVGHYVVRDDTEVESKHVQAFQSGGPV